MQNETIVIIDFGGQYNQLIARRVREANVYCEVVPYSKTVDEIKALNPKGIIFTGGPNSVFDDDAPKVDSQVFDWYSYPGYMLWRAADEHVARRCCSPCRYS